jgi:hypothetical protein
VLPAFGCPACDAGTLVPGSVFGLTAADAGVFGAEVTGAVAAGWFGGVSLALGTGAPWAGAEVAGGAGGAPLAPGTGKALAFGRAWPAGSAFGATLAGTGTAFWPGAPGVPGLAAGLTEALGGTGSLPC